MSVKILNANKLSGYVLENWPLEIAIPNMHFSNLLLRKVFLMLSWMLSCCECLGLGLKFEELNSIRDTEDPLVT